MSLHTKPALCEQRETHAVQPASPPDREAELDATDELNRCLRDSHVLIKLLWSGLGVSVENETDSPFDVEALHGTLGVIYDRITAAQVAADVLDKARMSRSPRRAGGDQQ